VRVTDLEGASPLPGQAASAWVRLADDLARALGRQVSRSPCLTEGKTGAYYIDDRLAVASQAAYSVVGLALPSNDR